jgi:hypothetical protein
MAEDNDDDEARRRAQEIARYRLAAEETPEQLKWCVNYLNRIPKRRIAEAIDNNRRRIHRQMRGTGGRTGAGAEMG